MKSLYLASIMLLLLLSNNSFSQFNPVSNPDDINWSGRFAHPGLFNRAQVVTTYNATTVVFAGSFELPSDSGGFDDYLLAFWDGSDWKIEGPGSFSVNENVYCICVVGTDVYIGGNFTTLNSQPIAYLARWNGTQWSSVGGGVNGSIRALTTDGFNLFAGGEFSMAGTTEANNIAKWDGAGWSALVEQGGLTNGVNNTVRAIALGGDGIYVGGDFSIAGGTNANFAARYTSTGIWESIGVQWTVGSVSSIGIAVDHIYLGGYFNTANGWPGNGIVRSSGTGGWEALGNGSPVGVPKLLVNASGFVFALGDFSADAGPAANQIAEWNGAGWAALGSEPFITGQTVDFTLSEPNTLYTAKFEFQNQSYLYGNGIYKWDGTSWSGAGLGIGDYWTTVYQANTLAWFNSQLYAGGNFLTAGDKFINGLSRLNNNSWADAGNSSQTTNLSIKKLLTVNNKLYAAGNFISINGITLNHIASWDGSQWSPLGSGTNGNVETIQAIGSDIYISGDFSTAGGNNAIGYARWDGNSWHSLAGGGPFSYTMTNIGSDLYAGGQFTSINGGTVLVENLAKWDGSSWYDVGGGVSMGSNFTTSVYALAARGNDLVVGGNFTMAGSIPANNIAIWDGTQWSTLGDGLNGPVRDILVSGSDIYVGGQFTEAGGNITYSIARWDGTSWHPLGSGINQSNNFAAIATVNSLLASPDGLYAGGQFTHAGDKYSNMIALYTDFTTGIKTESSIPPEKYSLSQNYPNPFNPSTNIDFSIPRQELVQLKIYDAIGEEIVTLIDGVMNQGNYSIKFDARNLASGIYFYKLRSGNFYKVKKMVLTK